MGEMSNPESYGSLSIKGGSFTVDDAIEKIGLGKYQLYFFLIVGLSWAADAMEVLIMSLIPSSMACDWDLQTWQEALISTMVFVGMFVGSFIWGIVADRIGRKTTLMLTCTIAALFGIASAFSPNYLVFLLLRGLTGIGIAGLPQSVTIFSEFLPAAHRGKGIIMLSAWWALGSIVQVLIGWTILGTFGWRTFLIVSSLPLILFTLLSLKWLPESPRYLMVHGRNTKAMEILSEMARINKEEMPEGELVYVPAKHSARFSDLFIPQYLLTSFLLIFLWTSTTLTYYGIIFLSTLMLGKVNNGCSVSTEFNSSYFSNDIVNCVVLSNTDYLTLLVTAISELPGLLFALVVLDNLGRKKSMTLLCGLFSFFTAILHICVPKFLMSIFIFFARGFIFAMFEVLYVYTSEFYPTLMRGTALGFFGGLGRFGAILAPIVAQAVGAISIRITLTIFTLFALIGAFIGFCIPVETAGKHLTEVPDEDETP